MPIEGMNHFNVLTDDVDATRRFYVGVLGLEEVTGRRSASMDCGLRWRPPDPAHLRGETSPGERAGVIDHIAFTSVDLKGTVARLEASHIKYRLSKQVGTNLWQVFCHDPMGARSSWTSTGPSPRRDLARLHVHAQHRIEVVALVPARMSGDGRTPAARSALRELGIGFEPALELGGERRIGAPSSGARHPRRRSPPCTPSSRRPW